MQILFYALKVSPMRILFSHYFKRFCYIILIFFAFIAYACTPECKTECYPGADGNGGKELNSDGFCEYFCSAPVGTESTTRYCGVGRDYEGDVSIDCRGCGLGRRGESRLLA